MLYRGWPVALVLRTGLLVMGKSSITSARHVQDSKSLPAVSLLFDPGARPGAQQIRQLAVQTGAFAIGSDMRDEDQPWLELVSNGLTFDLRGLAPGASTQPEPTVHQSGLDASFPRERCETISITPGPHLAAGGAMLAVVRALAMIAACCTRLDGTQAVAWHPARALSEASYFRRGVTEWNGGGSFPGLCLAALAPTGEGGLQSEGLALFTGQELSMHPEVVTDQVQASGIALRLLDWLVQHGPVTQGFELAAPAGGTLRLEPGDNPHLVSVRKDAPGLATASDP